MPKFWRNFKKIRAMDFSEYKDQSEEILKEIGVDDESSDNEADFEMTLIHQKTLLL